MSLSDRELQSLRNLGNLAEEAADEIERLRALADQHRDGRLAALEELAALKAQPEAIEQALQKITDFGQEQEPEYWQWRQKGERWGIDQIYRHEVYATTDDSEVRQLFATPKVGA